MRPPPRRRCNGKHLPSVVISMGWDAGATPVLCRFPALDAWLTSTLFSAETVRSPRAQGQGVDTTSKTIDLSSVNAPFFCRRETEGCSLVYGNAASDHLYPGLANSAYLKEHDGFSLFRSTIHWVHYPLRRDSPETAPLDLGRRAFRFCSGFLFSVAASRRPDPSGSGRPPRYGRWTGQR